MAQEMVGPRQPIAQIEQELAEQASSAIGYLEEQEEREGAFREKYGEEFGELALQYGKWVKNGMEHWVKTEKGLFKSDEFQRIYAEAFMKEINAQPEDQRVEWLGKFLINQKNVAARNPSFFKFELL